MTKLGSSKMLKYGKRLNIESIGTMKAVKHW